MALQFQPYNVKTKEEKDTEARQNIAQQIATIPQLFAQYKLQKRQLELENMKLEMERRQLESQYGTGGTPPRYEAGSPVSTISGGGPEEVIFGSNITPPREIKETPEQQLARLGTERYKTLNPPSYIALGADGEQVPLAPGQRPFSLPKPQQLEKPPQGYRFTSSGGLEAIVGGPADRKIEEAEAKKGAIQKATIEQADRIMAKVDQAILNVGKTSTGIGAKLRFIPGTKAKNLASDLQTIKANLGFAELQAMRQASPAGGALGQIAVQELEFLQSTLASLDQEQSSAQIERNLREVRDHYDKWKQTVQQAEASESQTEPNIIDESPTIPSVGDTFQGGKVLKIRRVE